MRRFCLLFLVPLLALTLAAPPVLAEPGQQQPKVGLALSGGGRYATLASDGRDLDYLMAGEVGTRQASDDALATDQWREEGPWLVLLLLPLGALIGIAFGHNFDKGLGSVMSDQSFEPVLRAQRDHAAAHDQHQRVDLFQMLLDRNPHAAP